MTDTPVDPRHAHHEDGFPDQQQSQSDATIRELRQQVDRLTQQVGGVTSHFEQQGRTQLENHITQWAADKPLFDILAPHIATEMKAGAADLDAAYETVLQKYPQLAAIAKPDAKPDTKLEGKADAKQGTEGADGEAPVATPAGA